MITNQNILKDKELAEYLEKELSKYPQTPECFENPDYIPTKEELKEFTEYQLDYLLMSANMDVSDVLSYPDRSKVLKERYNLIADMISQEKKERSKSLRKPD